MAQVKEKFIELVENRSDLAADTLSVIVTAKTLKLPENKKRLLKEELKMPLRATSNIHEAPHLSSDHEDLDTRMALHA